MVQELEQPAVRRALRNLPITGSGSALSGDAGRASAGAPSDTDGARAISLLALAYPLSTRPGTPDPAVDSRVHEMHADAQGRDAALRPRFSLVLDAQSERPQLVSRVTSFVLSAPIDHRVVGDALTAWLGSAQADAPARLFVLVSPVPLTAPGSRPSGESRLLSALYRRFVDRRERSPIRDRLLILSGGGDVHELRALSTPTGDIIGHEVVVSQRKSRARLRPALLRYDLREWRAGRADEKRGARHADALISKSLGRAAQAGFAEVHLQAADDADRPPAVRVFFHLAGNTRRAELAPYLAGTREVAGRLELALRVDPGRNGVLLGVEAPLPNSEDLVQRCLHLQEADKVKALILAEQSAVLERRARRIPACKSRGGEAHLAGARDSFVGLALSGGGIRSATVSLGFMRELQLKKQLSVYDYVSSVSGGSYTNAYLQVMTSGSLLSLMGKKICAKNVDPEALLDQAFAPTNIELLHSRGSYLATGSGLLGAYNILRLLTSFLTSLLQHWLWLLTIIVLLGCLGEWLTTLPSWWWSYLLLSWVALVTVRLGVSRDWYVWRPRVQRLAENALNHVETWFLLCLAPAAMLRGIAGLPSALDAWIRDNVPTVPTTFVRDVLASNGIDPIHFLVLVAVGLTLVTSPNATSLHRYYSARLADAFLIGARIKNKLWVFVPRLFHQVVPLSILDKDDTYGPYPLFNGCLNLAGKDPAFAGQQTGDYFLLSPRFCGAKLVGYASTARRQQYAKLSLAEAVTCSGAAISPFQGRALPSAISTLLWFFNLRTDLWLPNPANPRPKWLKRMLGNRTVTWGPLRQLGAIFGHLSTESRFVNVSDGAFIDSLGVYELLRRRCSVIVAVDATMDPHYDFHDLRNLIRRAHQELGIKFQFLAQRPEDVIKPNLTTGISKACFVHATIRWPPEDGLPDADFYYVKSALPEGVLAPGAMSDRARAYATYHPKFPQESTSDQFFDAVQWQAYHELGRVMARELMDRAFVVDRRNVAAE